MNLFRPKAERDLEQLSAYLDGALSVPEAAQLERRLQAETELNRQLAELRATRELLRELPPVPVPRNFTLRPADVGALARPSARTAPAGLRWASAVVATLLAVALVGDALTTFGGRAIRGAAPAAEVAVRQEVEAEERLAASPEAAAVSVAEAPAEPTQEAPAAPTQEAQVGNQATQATSDEQSAQPGAALAAGGAAAPEAATEPELAAEETVAGTEARTAGAEGEAAPARDTPAPTIEPSPTTQPKATQAAPTPAVAQTGWGPYIRLIELGLAGLLLVLLALTFTRRRR